MKWRSRGHYGDRSRGPGSRLGLAVPTVERGRWRRGANRPRGGIYPRRGQGLHLLHELGRVRHRAWGFREKVPGGRPL